MSGLNFRLERAIRAGQPSSSGTRRCGPGASAARGPQSDSGPRNAAAGVRTITTCWEST